MTTRRPLPLDRVRGLLAADRGLSADQVTERRARHGFNDIAEVPPHAILGLLRDTASDPMIWFLAGTGALYAALGQATEALTLLVALLPLVGMDAFLHRRTRASSEGLRRHLAERATVLRDGERTEIAARDLVPGDLVFVEEGQWFPADGILVPRM